jgi:hypothetical protein
MADAFATITKIINSPPGQLAAGGVLAGIVWKFFERVEAVLTDNTKLEIAVWLSNVEVGKKIAPWPETFVTVFDRVFGKKYLSWKCFWRSCVASLAMATISATVMLNTHVTDDPTFSMLSGSVVGWLLVFISIVIGMCMIDFLSLLETRWLLGRMGRYKQTIFHILCLVGDLILTCALASYGIAFASFLLGCWFVAFSPPNIATHWPLQFLLDKLSSPALLLKETFNPGYYGPYLVDIDLRFVLGAAFFTSIWLWLYAGSGFILKAARRFDIGFDWFNRKFDIEKKPLQSIGLVAGALVAIVYWTAVIVSRVVG